MEYWVICQNRNFLQLMHSDFIWQIFTLREDRCRDRPNAFSCFYPEWQDMRPIWHPLISQNSKPNHTILGINIWIIFFWHQIPPTIMNSGVFEKKGQIRRYRMFVFLPYIAWCHLELQNPCLSLSLSLSLSQNLFKFLFLPSLIKNNN